MFGNACSREPDDHIRFCELEMDGLSGDRDLTDTER